MTPIVSSLVDVLILAFITTTLATVVVVRRRRRIQTRTSIFLLSIELKVPSTTLFFDATAATRRMPQFLFCVGWIIDLVLVPSKLVRTLI